MDNAQAKAALLAVRERREVEQRQRFRRSKLLAHRAELVALRHAGASFPDLVVWLRTTKKLRVHHTTVMRFLSDLPELNAQLSEQ